MVEKERVLAKKKNFEAQLDALKQVVKEMESGELGLEELLAHFEKGMAMAGSLEKILDEAEQKIEWIQSGSPEEDLTP
jgi:exodeoxyribonuclease VII small subunit